MAKGDTPSGIPNQSKYPAPKPPSGGWNWEGTSVNMPGQNNPQMNYQPHTNFGDARDQQPYEKGYYGDRQQLQVMRPSTPQQDQFNNFYRDYWAPDRSQVLGGMRAPNMPDFSKFFGGLGGGGNQFNTTPQNPQPGMSYLTGMQQQPNNGIQFNPNNSIPNSGIGGFGGGLGNGMPQQNGFMYWPGMQMQPGVNY